MIPSRETLVEAERRTQFSAPQLEIVIRLRDLLERIADDRVLADSLVLKGGTPLNLCFGAPPRLSVDLDFNYIGAADRAVMLKVRPDIVAALERLGRRAGYQAQRSAEDHAGQKFYWGVFERAPYNLPRRVSQLLAQICCHNKVLPDRERNWQHAVCRYAESVVAT